MIVSVVNRAPRLVKADELERVADPTAVGWHERDARGVPYGFVSLALAEALGEPWSVTLSHEALEMIGDPEVNLLVLGPHPDAAERRRVLHWYELCDAVQD